MKSCEDTRKSITGNRRSASPLGLSIVELLIALSISAMLLTATMVALNASFYAYASAAESASTQSSVRLVMQRLLGMIRTTTEHSAYEHATQSYWLGPPSGPPVQSSGVAMINPRGRKVCVWWAVNPAYGDADLGDLYYWEGDLASDPPADLTDAAIQPLLERVRTLRNDGDDAYLFSLASRHNERKERILIRATADLRVEPGADATLALEEVRGASADVRLVGSAVPRRNVR